MNVHGPSLITDAIIKELRGSMSTLYFEASDYLILRKIVFIALLHGHNSPNRTIYATPGEAWIAEHTGYHRNTISRRVSYLQKKGYLAITYRRKLDGQWQTNLYRFGNVLWAMIKSITQRFRSFFNRAPSMVHIVTSKGDNTLKKDEADIFHPDIKELLTRIENKITFNDGSPGRERPGKEEM